MKVHFTASITGKKLYRDNYTRIVNELQRCGYQITDMITTKEKKDMENLSSAELNANYKTVYSNIKNADVVVAEVSYSSVSVGFEVTTALKLLKKVLLMHVPTNHISLLEAVKDRNMTICEYNLENLEEKLRNALKVIEKDADVRFNFFVPKELAAQLDHMSLNERVNKSEYIRQLIEKDMKKNKSYKNRI